MAGGRENSLSVIELTNMLSKYLRVVPVLRYGAWRPNDPKVTYYEIGKMRDRYGWRPEISVADGVHLLIEWCREII